MQYYDVSVGLNFECFGAGIEIRITVYEICLEKYHLKNGIFNQFLDPSTASFGFMNIECPYLL